MALAAREALKGLVGSGPSIEVLVESEPPRSETILGRRRWALEYVSESIRMPGPTDLRGGLAAVLTLETGGYWLWRRARTGAGAVRPSPEDDHDEAIDDVLGCRTDVLDLPIKELERPARVAVVVVAEGMEPRLLPAVICAELVLSEDLATGLPLESRMLPAPVGEGNWVSLKSVDADSILA